MKKIHITQKIKDYDKLNCLSLRFAFENETIIDSDLIAAGNIHNDPSTWAIDCETSDGMNVGTFLYQSESEYNEDLALLGFNKIKQ